MRFIDGFWFGLGLLCAATIVGVVAYWTWFATAPKEEPEPEEEPDEAVEDRRPEWMRARSGKPYDPTAGYVPKRKARRSGELTTPPET